MAKLRPPAAFGNAVCSQCKSEKSLSEFHVRKRTPRDPCGHRAWCKKCESRANRERFASKHGDRYRLYHKNWNLVSKYGITLEQYQEMMDAQGGLCAICRKSPLEKEGKKYLVVDHDHVTGRIRGLLCNDCNIGIGKLGDTTEGVAAALKYLQAQGGNYEAASA